MSDNIRSNRSIFLLTRLSRGVTEEHSICPDCYKISTHTPLARRDSAEVGSVSSTADFYSHASREA